LAVQWNIPALVASQDLYFPISEQPFFSMLLLLSKEVSTPAAVTAGKENRGSQI
jgi:hypothetical protein